MRYSWTFKAVVVEGVAIGRIADPAGGKLRHVLRPADLPHRPVAEPEPGGDHVVAAYHEASATISRRVVHEVLVMLNGHASIPLSITTDSGRGAGITVLPSSCIAGGKRWYPHHPADPSHKQPLPDDQRRRCPGGQCGKEPRGNESPGNGHQPQRAETGFDEPRVDKQGQEMKGPE